MKRFLMFTLTMLLATLCLVLTDADAYDWDSKSKWFFDHTVYGSIYITTDFDDTNEIASLYFFSMCRMMAQGV